MKSGRGVELDGTHVTINLFIEYPFAVDPSVSLPSVVLSLDLAVLISSFCHCFSFFLPSVFSTLFVLKFFF
ncbi:hypothetical protein BDV25DRAFT_165611 [Aspergillus avenaceus]|uniref:Uncharacterized protein n=1 Tax=Aspergillus avenaceus TaxID=36643 RepID=A0A5N6TFA9_ASPAV|nr:hypothetical protein BDV25DRAFT_165611 [Aspergillus avenaceus]